MAAIVTGEGLGLFNTTTPYQGSIGQGQLGQSRETVAINVSTGNLILQNQEATLKALGHDVGVLRTYNSLGGTDFDNNDQWKIGYNRRVSLVGVANTAGSSVERVTADGYTQKYDYDVTKKQYISTAGADSHDKLIWHSDGTASVHLNGHEDKESYDNKGRLIGLISKAEHELEIFYKGNYLHQIKTYTDNDVETTTFNYDGDLLKSIETQFESNSKSTQVYYEYDSEDRLSHVKVDLTPQDNSISDGAVYETSYTYHGTSNRIHTISQSDGTTTSIDYYSADRDGNYKVKSVTDGEGNKTDYQYLTASLTRVTNNGRQIDYLFDGELLEAVETVINNQKVRTSYEYDDKDNLVTVTDNLSNSVSYEYDSDGNLTFEEDSIGREKEYFYNSENRLVRFRDDIGTNHNVYARDSLNLSYLRFNISANGNVTEYKHNSAGQLISEHKYTSSNYALSNDHNQALSSPSYEEVVAWVANLDKKKQELTLYKYDIRGNVNSIKKYSAVDSKGNGLGQVNEQAFVYDAKGRVLKEILRGAGESNSDLVTNYAYDGLGRIITTTRPDGATTSRVYLDNKSQIITKRANGLWEINQYDKNGRLQSVTRQSGENSTKIDTHKYFYNEVGQVVAIEDQQGARSYSLYDSLDRLAASVDELGIVTRFHYDSLNNRISEVTYEKTVNTKDWLTSDNKLSQSLSQLDSQLSSRISSTENRAVFYVYNSSRELVFSVDGKGGITSYSYDARGLVERQTRYANTISFNSSNYENGITASFIRTELAKQTDEEKLLNRSVSYSYDADGRLIEEKDGEHNITQYFYDSAGNRVAQYQQGKTGDDIVARKSYWFYNAKSEVIAEISPDGIVTSFEYDTRGNLFNRKVYETANNNFQLGQNLVLPTGRYNETSYQYDENNRLILESSTGNVSTYYKYDNVGQLIERWQGDSSDINDALTSKDKDLTGHDIDIERYQYNLLGQRTAELDANQNDALGVNVSSDDLKNAFSNNALKTTYDLLGNVATTTDREGNKTAYYYNSDNQLLFLVDAEGQITEYQYNSFGQISSERNYLTQLSSAEVETLIGGQLETQERTLFESKKADNDFIEINKYDNRGSLVESVDAEGYKTSFDYNAFTQVIRETYQNRLSNTSSVTDVIDEYQYDRRGLLVSTTNNTSGNSVTSSVEYDAFARVIKRVDGNGNVTTYSYKKEAGSVSDSVGRVVTTEKIVDGITRKQVSQYDMFDRLLLSTDSFGSTTSYQYDDANNTISVTDAEQNKVVTSRDSHGRISEVKVYDRNDITLKKTKFEYDNNGNTTSVFVNDQKIESAEFDKNNRVVSNIDANGNRIETRYDKVGRVTTSIIDPNGLSNTTHWRYNKAGTEVIKTIQINHLDSQENSEVDDNVTKTLFDAKGRIKRVEQQLNGTNEIVSTEYKYDRTGNKLKVINGAGSTNQLITDYQYDNLGRRVKMIEGDQVTEYAYDDNDNLIKRTRYSADKISDNSVNREVTYLTYNEENELYAEVEINSVESNQVNATVKTYEYDKNGRQIAYHSYKDYLNLSSISSSGTHNVSKTSPIDTTQVFNLTNQQVKNRLGQFVVNHQAISEYTAYDKLNRKIAFIDGNKALTVWEYDEQGFVTEVYQKAEVLGDISSLVTNIEQGTVDVSQLRAHDSGTDSKTSNVYDGQNRVRFSLTLLSNGQASLKESVYDNRGNVISTIAYADTIAYKADYSEAEIVQLLKGKQDDGQNRSSQLYYDNANRLRFSIDSQGVVTELRYNNADELTHNIQYSSPIQSTTLKHGYDNSALNIATLAQHYTHSVLHASDRVSQTIYDSVGRISEKVDAQGYSETYTYYENGLKESYTDKSGNKWHYKYNSAGLLSVEISPKLSSLRTLVGNNYENYNGYAIKSYKYDGLGNVTEIKEGFHKGETIPETLSFYGQTRTTTFEYDLAGNQISVLQAATRNAPKTRTLTKYDGLGRAVVNELYANDELKSSAYKIYDNSGQLKHDIQVINPIYLKGSSGIGGEANVTSYAYDALGNQINVTRYSKQLDLKTIDGKNSWQHGEPLSEADINGFISQPDSNSRTISIAYDASGRKTSITESSLSYRYIDDNGQVQIGQARPKTTYSYNSFGQVWKTSILEKIVAGKEYTIDSYSYYDNLGNKVAEVDAEGGLTKWQYTSFGEIARQTEFARRIDTKSLAQDMVPVSPANGNDSIGFNRVTEYKYDALGRQTEETKRNVIAWDSNSSVVTKRSTITATTNYDEQGRVISTVDNGNRTDIDYDALGNVTQTQSAAFRTLKSTDASELNANDNLENTSNYDTKRSTTYFYYDAFGNVVNNVLNGVSTKTLYNDRGQAIIETDALGNQTENHYNYAGKITKKSQSFTESADIVSHSISQVIQIPYEEHEYGRSTGRTGTREEYIPLPKWLSFSLETGTFSGVSPGNETIKVSVSITVNGTVRQLGRHDIPATSGRSVSYTIPGYPTNLNLSQVVKTSEISLEYDGIGQLVSRVIQLDKNGSKATESSDLYRYNSFGDIIEGDDGYYTYNSLGNIYQTNEKDNILKTNFYDLAGRIVITQNAGSGDTIYQHDKLGNKIVVSQAEFTQNGEKLAPEIKQQFDRWGNVIEFIDSRGHQYSYQYNHDNKVTVEYKPEANEVTETGTVNRVRQKTSYRYDFNGRLVQTIDHYNNVKTNRYDDVGNLIKETDALGNSRYFAYDIFGRKVAEQNEADHITTTTYDILGQVVATGDIRYNSSSKSFENNVLNYYDYDEVGNRVGQTDALGHTHAYRYDARGNIVRSLTPNGIDKAYEYDSKGRKTLEKFTRLSNSAYYRNTWSYDRYGRITKRNDLGGVDYNYTYVQLDSLNSSGNKIRDFSTRLASVTNGHGQNLSYSYYENGLLKQITDNTTGAESEYRYNGAGQRVWEREKAKNAFGEYVHQVTQTSYDELGRIDKIITRDLNTDKVVSKLLYAYDALGNRRNIRVWNGYKGSIEKANQGPANNSDKSVSVRQGSSFSTHLQFSDADNESLNFLYRMGSTGDFVSLTKLQEQYPWLDIKPESTTGKVNISGNIPLALSKQTLRLEVKASDGISLSDADTLTITVTEKNYAPVANFPTPFVVDEGTNSLNLASYFTDANSADRVVVNIANASGLTFNGGTLTGIDYDSSGVYQISGTYTDGNIAETLNFDVTLTVNHKQKPPVIASDLYRISLLSNQDNVNVDFSQYITDSEGTSQRYFLEYVDSDNSSGLFSVDRHQTTSSDDNITLFQRTGLSLDPNTGILSGNVKKDAPLNNDLRLTVVSGPHSVSKQIQIRLNAPREVIVEQTVSEGSSYTLDLATLDLGYTPDYQTLRVLNSDNNFWQIVNQKQVEFTPGFNDSRNGYYEVVVRVSEPFGNIVKPPVTPDQSELVSKDQSSGLDSTIPAPEPVTDPRISSLSPSPSRTDLALIRSTDIKIRVLVSNVNQAPTHTLPSLITIAPGTRQVDLSGYFSDADGDPVSVNITNTSGLTASGAVLSNFPASGSFTVSGTYSDGISAAQNFSVTIDLNTAPQGQVSDKVIQEGVSVNIPLSREITDANGDQLTFTVVTRRKIELDDGGKLPTPGPAPTPVPPEESLQKQVQLNNNVSVSDDSQLSGVIASQVAKAVYIEVPFPEGLSIDNQGNITGVASFNTAGEYLITVTASDGRLQVTDDFKLTIENTNQAPRINRRPQNISITENLPWSVTLPTDTFVDPEQGAVVLDVVSKPNFISWNKATRTLGFTPNYGAEGNYKITIRGTDNKGNYSEIEVPVEVIDVNRPPVSHNAIGRQQAAYNASWSFVVPSDTFIDHDGDSFSYSLVNAPSWLSFNESTRTISAVSSNKPLGNHTVTVRARDTKGGFNETSFILELYDPNRAPNGSVGDKVISEGNYVSYQLNQEILDPDNDSLTFTYIVQQRFLVKGGDEQLLSLSSTKSKDAFLGGEDSIGGDASVGGSTAVWEYRNVAIPAGLTFGADGHISGSAGYSTAGEYVVFVTASDGKLNKVEQFKLTIDNTNRSPAISNQVQPVSINENDPWSLTLPSNTFTDPDGGPVSMSLISNHPFIRFEAGNRLVYTKGYSNAGTHDIVIRGRDLDGGTTDMAIRLNISDVNRAPVVNKPIGAQAVKNNEPWSLVIPSDTFIDPDGGTVAYSITSKPSWVSWNASTRTLSVTSSLKPIGNHKISLKAADKQGLSRVIDISLAVIDSNRAPQGSIVDKVINEGNYVSYPLTDEITDPDGNALTFSYQAKKRVWVDDLGVSPLSVSEKEEFAIQAIQEPIPIPGPTPGRGYWHYYNVSMPSGLTINSNGHFSGTAGYTTAGEYFITVTATDGKLQRTDEFKLTINNTNRVPVVNKPINNITVNENQSWALTLPSDTFRDPDGGGVSIDVINKPSFISWNASTRQLSFSPNFNASGTHDIVVRGTDIQGSHTDMVIRFTVNNINRAPTASTLPSRTYSEGQSVNFNIAKYFSDPDGNSITFSASNLPAGLSMNSAGTVTGTLSYSSATLRTVTVTAKDSLNATTSRTFTFTVNNTNRAPTGSTLPERSYSEGNSVNFNISSYFSDPDGQALTFTASNLPPGVSINSQGVVSGTLTYTSSGNRAVTITARDPNGRTVSRSFTFKVANVNLAPSAGTLPSRTYNEGNSVNFNIANYFSDPDGNSITFSASNLPAGLSMNSAGTVTGTLSYSSATSRTVTVTARDSLNATTSRTFTFRVNNVNRAPTASSLPNRSYSEGNGVNFNVSGYFSDPDGQALTFSASNLPPGLVINSLGVVHGTLNYTSSGNRTVTITARDPNGETVARSFTFSVANVNRAPTAGTLPNRTYTEGNRVNLNVSGYFSDPDGQSLRFSASNLPQGLSISSSGVISGTLTYTSSGSKTVTVTARDSSNAPVSRSFTFVVRNQNRAPTGNIPNISLNEAESVNRSLASYFNDPDGDRLTYSVQAFRFNPFSGEATLHSTTNSSLGQYTPIAMPQGISINSAGQLTGKPSYTSSGVYVIRVTASDGSASTTDEFNLEIKNVNAAPTVGSIGNRSAKEGDRIGFSIASHFNDIDGDRLSYSATGLPPGVLISSNGYVTGLLNYSSSGNYLVSVTASDGKGGKVTGLFGLNVANVAIPANKAPVANKTLSAIGFVGEKVVIRIDGNTFTDPDGDPLTYSVSNLPTGLYTRANGSEIVGQVNSPWNGNLIVTASDGKGGSATTTLYLSITSKFGIGLPKPPVSSFSSFSARSTAQFDAPSAQAFSAPVASASLFSLDSISQQESVEYKVAEEPLLASKSVKAQVIPEQTAETDDVWHAVISAQARTKVALTEDFTNLTGKVSYQVEGLPKGFYLSKKQNALVGKARAGSEGQYEVTVTATDGQGQKITKVLYLTVRENQAPILTKLPDQEVSIHSPVNINIPKFVDPDGEAVKVKVRGLPKGLYYRQRTNTIVGQIQATDVGEHTIRVIARDKSGSRVEERFTLTVGQGKNANIGSSDDFNIAEGPEQAIRHSEITNGLAVPVGQVPELSDNIFSLSSFEPKALAQQSAPALLSAPTIEPVVFSATAASLVEEPQFTTLALSTESADVAPKTLSRTAVAEQPAVFASASIVSAPTSEPSSLRIGDDGEPIFEPPITQPTIAAKGESYWFGYDANNRVTLDGGSLVNNQLSIATQGQKISYNEIGKQSEVIRSRGISAERYFYNDVGLLSRVMSRNNQEGVNFIDNPEKLAGDWRNLSAHRYDDLNRVVETTNFWRINQNVELELRTEEGLNDFTVHLAGAVKDKQVTSYDGDGNVRLVEQWGLDRNYKGKLESNLFKPGELPFRPDLVIDGQDGFTDKDLVKLATIDYYNYDNTGQLKAYNYRKHAKAHDDGTSLPSSFTWNYNYTHELRDTILEKSVRGSGYTSGDGRFQASSTYSTYDVNGNRISVEEGTGADDSVINARHFFFSADNKLIRKYTGEHDKLLSSVVNPTKSAVGFDNQGTVSNYHYSGGNYIGELNSLGNNYVKEQHFKAPNETDTSSTQKYTVRAGDTLRTIAEVFYGNEEYWYLIADANGLSDDIELKEGQALDIPQRADTSNSFDNFKPINLAQAIGDTTPNIAYIPPPPDSGCNAIATIIMVAVAVAVTVATAGAASGAVGTAVSSLGLGTTATAGLTAAGSYAIGGFVGSVASQLVGKALGAVDSFSLRNAFASGIISGITAGTGEYLRAGATANGILATIEAGEKVLTSAGSAVVAGVAAVGSVAANKLVGNPASFSWRNVATSAVSAYAGAELGLENVDIIAGGETTGRILNDALIGIAGAGITYGVGKALQRGDDRPSWNFRNVAADAFGNAIGNSVAGKIQDYRDRKQLQEAITEAFSRPSGNNSNNSNNAIPDWLNIYDSYNNSALEYQNYSSDYEFNVADQLRNYHFSKSVVVNEQVNAARANFDRDAVISAENRAKFRESLSELRDRRLTNGNARASFEFDQLRPTTGFNGNFTEAEWLATINNKTQGAWKSELTRDVLTIVGLTASLPLIAGSNLGLSTLAYLGRQGVVGGAIGSGANITATFIDNHYKNKSTSFSDVIVSGSTGFLGGAIGGRFSGYYGALAGGSIAELATQLYTGDHSTGRIVTAGLLGVAGQGISKLLPDGVLSESLDFAAGKVIGTSIDVVKNSIINIAAGLGLNNAIDISKYLFDPIGNRAVDQSLRQSNNQQLQEQTYFENSYLERAYKNRVGYFGRP